MGDWTNIDFDISSDNIDNIDNKKCDNNDDSYNNDDYCNNTTYNANNNIKYIYDKENKIDQIKRIKNILHLYQKYNSSFFDINLIKKIIGLDIIKNDIESMILQEKYIIKLYIHVNKKPIYKSILEKKYIGRKTIKTEIKCNTLLCSYRLPKNYYNQFGNNSDPYYIFMKNNSIKGYLYRLHWDQKISDSYNCGFLTKYHSDIEFIKI